MAVDGGSRVADGRGGGGIGRLKRQERREGGHGRFRQVVFGREGSQPRGRFT